MRQNITVSVEKELAGKLRAIAAARATSISAMLSDELRRIVEQAERFEVARRRALADLERGFDFGLARGAGGAWRPPGRDALHDRAALRAELHPDHHPDLHRAPGRHGS